MLTPNRVRTLSLADLGIVAGGPHPYDMLTGAEGDAVTAALRLLATSLANGLVSPDDGDIGSVLTCSGAHPGLTADEVHDLCDRLQFSPFERADASEDDEEDEEEPEVPLDTPSLDTSFHDHEMDVD